jgi:hypothetical protein
VRSSSSFKLVRLRVARQMTWELEAGPGHARDSGSTIRCNGKGVGVEQLCGVASKWLGPINQSIDQSIQQSINQFNNRSISQYMS